MRPAATGRWHQVRDRSPIRPANRMPNRIRTTVVSPDTTTTTTGTTPDGGR
jgi:hypothetical protein